MTTRTRALLSASAAPRPREAPEPNRQIRKWPLKSRSSANADRKLLVTISVLVGIGILMAILSVLLMLSVFFLF